MVKRRGKRLIKKLFLVILGLGLFFSGLILVWISTFKIPDLGNFEERKIKQSTKILMQLIAINETFSFLFKSD